MNSQPPEQAPLSWPTRPWLLQVLALATPLLLLLALLVLLSPRSTSRLRALPALVISSGMLLTSLGRRRRRRHRLLQVLRNDGTGA